MDSEHRHELKENDLAEFLRNCGQWWARRGSSTLMVLLIVLVGLAGYRLLRSRVNEQRQLAWRDVASVTSPASYRSVAEMTGQPVVQAIAYLRGADLLLQDTLTEPKEDDPPKSATTMETLAEAEAMYHTAIEVVEREQLDEAITLNAWLGLASVHESRGEFDEAEKLYQEIQDAASDNLPALAAIARRRVQMLPRLRLDIIFAPDPITEENPDAASVENGALPGEPPVEDSDPEPQEEMSSSN